jgi:hypothetical protein
MTPSSKQEFFQIVLMVLAFIADIALIVNICHHW